MASCHGKTEAFARSLSSKLRTLSNVDNNARSTEGDPIIDKGSPTTHNESNDIVGSTQPHRHEMNSLFFYDCKLESPGSPIDECGSLSVNGSNPHQEPGISSSFQDISQSSLVHESLHMSTELQTCSLQHITALKIEPNEEVAGGKIHSLFNLKYCQNEMCKNQNPEQNESSQICDSKTSNDQHGLKLSIQLHNKITTENELQIEDPVRSFSVASSMSTPRDAEHNRKNMEYDIISLEKSEATAPLFQRNFEASTSPARSLEVFTPSIIDFSQKNLLMSSDISDEKSHLLRVDVTDDEEECRPQRVRRCSSLKSGKTPPGTPGRKKIVRFADVLGLDLADVKTFLDEIPTIPKSAFEDLVVQDSLPQVCRESNKLLMPLFQQPGGLPTFLDLLRERRVSLENAAVTDDINHTITGSVRVRNIDFHKSVHVRYTLDNWRSYADLQANYVDKSCDGFSDKFAFTIFCNSLQIGQRIEFAIRFQCKGQQYWDNNYGTNYCFQCLPASNSSSNLLRKSAPSFNSNNSNGLSYKTVGDAWCTSFY